MSARRIEEQAARWLIRRDEPGWSKADEAALDAWLGESFTHKAAFWRLERGWSAADRLAATVAPAAPAAPRRRLAPLLMAAAVAFAALATALFLHLSPAAAPTEIRAETGVGGVRTVTLSDGSKVTLNTASSVRAILLGDRRDVWLDRGEAYFDVAHDASRPFSVFAGDKHVTVLGTRFSVRRDDDRMQVAVASGRVRISSGSAGSDRSGAVISAGDVALVRGRSILLAERSEKNVLERLSWRSGILHFDGVTLAEAAGEFNRYNEKQIRIADPHAARLRIGGSFEAANVDVFARLLGDAFGLEVADDGKTLTISS